MFIQMFDSKLAYAFDAKAIGAKSLMARIRQMNPTQNHEIAMSLRAKRTPSFGATLGWPSFNQTAF
jgi:hypothetical protein